ncbi:MAG: hydantoinase/carbamoylase family amidase [Acidimicrobiales bacterium]
MGQPEIRIDLARLLDRIETLGAIGAIVGEQPDHRGSARLALTEDDKLGRDLVVEWMRALGLEVSVDHLGNVVGTRAGLLDGPPVMGGWDIVTGASGGGFGGNLGVLAGLEVVATLNDADLTTQHPLAVAFFTNEEGCRFAPDMMGSLVYVGGLALEEALDTVGIDGTRVGDDLENIGYMGATPVPGAVPLAYVELHIEQGPVLEAEGTCIGVVEQVQGISWQEITISGESNHAGTTPMSHRHDAGYVAAHLMCRLHDIATDIGGDQVATCGALTLRPNLVNVVASRAVMTVDLRNTDEQILCEAEKRFATECDQVAEAEGVTISAHVLARFEPVDFDPLVIDEVEVAAESLGLSHRRMPSGAGHDAQMLARVCPSGMIFVPSINGISHNPAEKTDPYDLEAGANTLLRVMLALSDGQNTRSSRKGSYDS